MAETSLPDVRTFSFSAGDSRRSRLGDLTSLFLSCPNLAVVDINGWGTLRPVQAAHLRSLRIRDCALPVDDPFCASLGQCEFPVLRELTLEGHFGLGRAHVRAFLERAAPQLRSWSSLEALAEGGIEGLLEANAPRLTAVELHEASFDDYVDVIALHGIPPHWQKLSLSGPYSVDEEDAADFLREHAGKFANLAEFTLDFEFRSPNGALARLQRLCPQLTAICGE